MSKLKKIEDYLKLMAEYPNAFDNTAGELEIITDKATLYSEQEKLYSMADLKERPREWYDLGVVAQDAWVVVLRDLVKFPNGAYGCYTRKINRRSQLEQSGKDVTILVRRDGKLLLMKHFRHDDRAWHWECPRGYGEEGLTGKENALKEIREETGLNVLKIRQLNNDDNRVAYFLADCSGDVYNSDGTECISDVRFVTVTEFKELIADGLVNDQYTIKAFVLAEIQSLL